MVLKVWTQRGEFAYDFLHLPVRVDGHHPDAGNPLLDLRHGSRVLRPRLLGEDVDLLWLPAENLWPVLIDPSQVDQLLANLCVNARDAISDVGKLTIETSKVVLDNDMAAFHPGIEATQCPAARIPCLAQPSGHRR